MSACSDNASSGHGMPQRQDLYQFDSFGEMAATSDVVVLAEVTASDEGRVAGEPGPAGDGELQFIDFTIRPRELLKGETAESVVLEMDEHWLPFKVGDVAVFFLQAIEGRDDAYILISSTGGFVLGEDGIHPSNPEEDWVREVEPLSTGDFIEMVRDAIEQDSKPATPVVGE